MATKFHMESIRRKIMTAAPLMNASEKLAKKITTDVTVNAEYNFETNPITQEIEDGETARNSSGLLGGYGNLFSFIGFPVGATPTEIVKVLWTKVRFKGLKEAKIKGKKIVYSYEVSIPTPEDFQKSSPLPWASGRSWLSGISKGIANFGNYLSKEGQGRSKGGVQKKKKIHGGAMKTDPYFQKIYNVFSKTFKPWIKF